MKKRVTIKFNSRNGNQYIYDDITGNIFKWSNIHEKVLELLVQGKSCEDILNNLVGEDNIEKIVYDVYFWYKSNGAFYREDFDCKQIKYDNMENIVKSQMTQLILSVTDSCNLACKYCVFSDNYALTKNLVSNKHMSKDTAEKAINLFYQTISNQFTENPKKEYRFTFYGGEPLLNFEVVKFSVEYIKKLFKDKRFMFALTTNGTLLNEDMVKYLSDNNVSLAISFDGCEEEHNRNRVFRNGEGSFKTVIENIKMIKEKYNHYFETNIGLSSVFDLRTNLRKNEEYFDLMERNHTLPMHLFANQVIDFNTNYYSQFDRKDIEKYKQDMDYLENKYVEDKKNGKKSNTYLLSLMGPKFYRISLRQRWHDLRSIILSCTGTCMIGQKMSVGVDGNINMCERVNGKYGIGDIINGFDYEKIAKYIENYNEEVIMKCNGCPIQKMCGFCFMHFETANGYKSNSLRCNIDKRFVIETLSSYVSLLEERPDMEFDLQNEAFRVSAFQLINS